MSRSARGRPAAPPFPRSPDAAPQLAAAFSGPTLFGLATYPPGSSFGPRRMRGYELVWMIDGDAAYHCDGETFAAPAGSAVLCRDGARDGFDWDRTRVTRHGYVHFDLHRPPPSLPPPDRWPVTRRLPAADVVRPLLRFILTWGDAGAAPLLQLTVAQLVAAFVEGQISTREPPAAPLPDGVARALAHIYATLDADPGARITLRDLAAVAHVSPSQLSRQFGTATGRAPAETVRLARLDRAAPLVTGTNLPVATIAALAGFANPYHFSRRFKRAFGASPTALRRSVQAGELPPAPLLVRSSG